jgi:hypothetical protein
MRAHTLFVIALAAILLADSELRAASTLPRFTEEREAAALYFVRKHCPDLAPLLDELRKKGNPQYEQQVREIFRVTEMLAEIEDERRQQVELKIWKTENRALVLVAKLAVAREDDKKPLQSSLQDAARELVELDVQSLEIQTDQLEKELGETKDELARLKDNFDKSVRDRFDSLLDKAKKRSRKM